MLGVPEAAGKGELTPGHAHLVERPGEAGGSAPLFLLIRATPDTPTKPRAHRSLPRLAGSPAPDQARVGPLPQALAEAYGDAELAGYAASALATQLRARLDQARDFGHRIDVVAHGFGARAAMTMLTLLGQRWPEDMTLARIGRVILIDGACYWAQAASALVTMAVSRPATMPRLHNVISVAEPLITLMSTTEMLDDARAEALDELANRNILAPDEMRRVIGCDGTPTVCIAQACNVPLPSWRDHCLRTAAPWSQRHVSRVGRAILGLKG